MLSGLFFAEAVMSELATRRGIRVVSYEFPGWGGTVFIANDYAAGLYDTSKLWAARGRRPPTPAERERVLDEMAARRSGTSQVWQTYDANGGEPGATESARTRVVLFTNVSWDTAVTMRDIGFVDMYDWLTEVVDWARCRDDVILDIRVHPGETRMRGFETNDSAVDYIRGRFPQLPPHVRIYDADDAVNSYALIEQASVVLVYSSTIGLEAVVLGKPTLVAADSHYRNKGFTYDVAGPEHLKSLLENPVALTLAPAQHDLSITYSHLFFFDAMVHLRSIEERWRGKPVFRISEAAELDDDPAVELVCRLVLEEAAA